MASDESPCFDKYSNMIEHKKHSLAKRRNEKFGKMLDMEDYLCTRVIVCNGSQCLTNMIIVSVSDKSIVKVNKMAMVP